VSLAACIEITEQSTATDTHDMPLRVDRDGVEGAQVDHEPVITRAVTGDAVSATPDGHAQLALPSERDGCRHVAV
jgi:hypothetical protein